MEPFHLPSDARIGQVHLRVRDLDRARQFYSRALGFYERPWADATRVYAAGPDQPGLIALTADPHALARPPRTTGLYHVAIRFPTRRALGRTFQRLIEQRYPFQGAADHLVSEALYLADPDGNGLELYVDRPRSAWPWQAGQVAMSSDPLDLDGLLAEAAADPTPWNGPDPGTDIGHIHLQVADLARAEAFYAELLGLEVTQRSYPGALFLAAGGYHHHLGLNTWAGRGAPHAPERSVGLRSFRLEIPDLAARQTAIQRLKQAGVAVTARPGSNGAGRFFTQDPDGNQVEI